MKLIIFIGILIFGASVSGATGYMIRDAKPTKGVPITVDGDEVPGISASRDKPDTVLAYYMADSVHIKYLKTR